MHLDNIFGAWRSVSTSLMPPQPEVVSPGELDPGDETAAKPPNSRRRRVRRVILVCLLVASAGVWVGTWLTPEPLHATQVALFPRPVWVNGRVALITPGYTLTADLISYHDELFAYLMFDYLRHSPALGGAELLLTFDPQAVDAPYTLVVTGQPDLLLAFPDVAALAIPTGEAPRRWALVPASRVAGFEKQTHLFDAAYTLPVKQKLEELPQPALRSYLRRFIQFKSNTDPRVRRRIEPVPTPLSSKEALQLAGDIITIAEFYSLPLEFLLGIGAMENNYMDVRGDLKHSVWKRRPAPDDVVLEKRGGRVRILNDSAGVWQITRETLRFAHTLVQRDGRDYTTLPEHLRPPKQLRINEVSPQVLTTYAGALLRDLLDRFDGDVTLAVSAYNGGPARPNLRYGAGVNRAAAHARRILEQAAVLNGESVVRMTWLRRP